MPQYATIGSHPAADCPLANKAVRDFLMGMAPKWPDLEKQLNRDCPDQTDSSNHVTLWDGSNYKRAA